MEHLFVVESLAELQATPPDSGQYVQVAGHSQPGDGGDGLFCWRPQSVATDLGTTLPSNHSASGHWQRLYSGAINVRWFGALGDGRDNTAALQSALDTAAGGATVVLPSGSYRVLRPLKLHQGVALMGDGLGSILQYDGPAGTGCLQSHQPAKSWAFHVARLNIEVRSEAAYGVDLRGMSYSRFDDLHLHLRASNTSGFFGPGNGVSPYYNLFTACHVAGTANWSTNQCVGFDFCSDAREQRQSANSNSVIGGRISTCQIAVRCLGTGNMFYGQVLESGADGYVFDVPPGRLQDAQLGTSNDIIGCYSEHVERVIVQRHSSCFVNALLTMVTGYRQVFEAIDTTNCIVITSHDGSLPQSRSFVDRRIDFRQLEQARNP
ncbi:MAG: hypothetical protein CMJ75_06575 [Planctomycetaceae bacterium]|nr:hypothetical protein [Planctomycetaceae bacterium]